ncbi:SQUALENE MONOOXYGENASE-RELATED, partial [Salix koriyanagi]
MADQCIPGCILAALFGLSAIYYLVIKKKGQRANKDLLEARSESVNSIATTSGECRSSNVSDVDVIIVGAGVAGAALAHTLGKPGGYLKLIELGLEDCVEKIDAQRPEGAFTMGVSYRECGTKLHHSPMYNWSKELSHFAPLTIVCDGCFSNLRRSLCNPKVDVPSCFVGLILENCQLPCANHGHVILGDPSPILMYPISSTEVRCLVDVPGQKVPSISSGEMAKYLKTVVAPQLPPEVYDAFLAAVEKGNIRTMPNRSMPAAPYPTPGALLMGDAFNMRHPLTGGGMTVALADIVVLRNLLRPLCNLNDAPTLCKYLESFYTLRKPVASTINTLAGALYKVFCASPDQARKEMRQACFDYLSLGGVFSAGPVSLLSGLNPRPLSLVAHFFAVAMYGVGRLLLPFPSPKRIWIGARLISGASGIIFPIIRAEGVRQMFFPATVPAYYRAPPV